MARANRSVGNATLEYGEGTVDSGPKVEARQSIGLNIMPTSIDAAYQVCFSPR